MTTVTEQYGGNTGARNPIWNRQWQLNDITDKFVFTNNIIIIVWLPGRTREPLNIAAILLLFVVNDGIAHVILENVACVKKNVNL